MLPADRCRHAELIIAMPLGVAEAHASSVNVLDRRNALRLLRPTAYRTVT